MSKKHPEGLRDFPASQPWADLIDKGPGRLVPPTQVPSDENATKKSLANLQRLTGFTPPTETDQQPLEPVKIFHGESPAPPSAPVEQTDFLHLVPAEATATKPEAKGREPKKIPPKWHSDQEPSIQIITDPYSRGKALSSDVGHEATLRRQQLRIKLGLPEKAPPWKETLQKFHALTEEDKAILSEMGYKPERVRNIYSLTVERMLRDLQRYRDSK